MRQLAQWWSTLAYRFMWPERFTRGTDPRRNSRPV